MTRTTTFLGCALALVIAPAGGARAGAAPSPAAPATLPTLPTPYVARNVCPFECCTYRRWVARAVLPVFAVERDTSKVAFTIAPGDSFDALTGDVHVLAPGIAHVRRALRIEAEGVRLDLRPGERLALLDYLGEGYYHAWVRGRFVDVGPDDIAYPDAQPDTANWLDLVREPVSEWWVKVRALDGREGWIRVGRREDEPDVGNADACG